MKGKRAARRGRGRNARKSAGLHGLPCPDGHESKRASRVLPDTRDVSYRIDRGSAVLVAREEVEIRSSDFAIRKVVEVVL